MAGLDERLARWREAPGSAGILTDFDGTLAPIVGDPEAARPLPGAADTLIRLARRCRVVAVISGRPVTYLVDWLGPLPGVTLVGLYGLERREHGGVLALPEAQRWRSVVAQVTEAGERQAPPGVYIEAKGLTVGVHFRKAPHAEGWVNAWVDAQAAQSGLVVHHGKMAVELVPPVATDKGVVVTQMAAGLEAVCYLGDDLGDLPAFWALSRLSAIGVTTVSVAVHSAETPAEVLAHADLVVEGPEGALEFLQHQIGPS